MRWADAVHVNGLSARGVGRRGMCRGPTHGCDAADLQALSPTGLAWAAMGIVQRWPAPRAVPRLPLAGCVSRRRAGDRRPGGSFRVHKPPSASQDRACRTAVGYPDPVDVPPWGDPGDRDCSRATSWHLPAGSVRRRGSPSCYMRSAWFRTHVYGQPAMAQCEGHAERLAEDLGVASQTSLLGALPAAWCVPCTRTRRLRAPSLWPEPFGYAAAEAMALGRPVVGLPSGALARSS